MWGNQTEIEIGYATQKTSLNSLLRIATEMPSDGGLDDPIYWSRQPYLVFIFVANISLLTYGFTNDDFNFFVDELRRLNPNVRIKL